MLFKCPFLSISDRTRLANRACSYPAGCILRLLQLEFRLQADGRTAMGRLKAELQSEWRRSPRRQRAPLALARLRARLSCAFPRHYRHRRNYQGALVSISVIRATSRILTPLPPLF